jgi:hypothetical protein
MTDGNKWQRGALLQPDDVESCRSTMLNNMLDAVWFCCYCLCTAGWVWGARICLSVCSSWMRGWWASMGSQMNLSLECR